MTENLCILGSTGSIGRQAVETARHLGIRVCAISGGRNEDLVCEQALMLKPDIVAMADENAGKSVKTRLASENCRVVWGKEAIESLAAESKCDTVLDSIVGIAGLRPLLAAIPLGIKVALANK
ncbi:MAG: 1-deoxy-D-xylulose-5-phosphate reductoisomerase, partial [Oscillospiraceae bacterium]